MCFIWKCHWIKCINSPRRNGDLDFWILSDRQKLNVSLLCLARMLSLAITLLYNECALKPSPAMATLWSVMSFFSCPGAFGVPLEYRLAWQLQRPSAEEGYPLKPAQTLLGESTQLKCASRHAENFGFWEPSVRKSCDIFTAGGSSVSISNHFSIHFKWLMPHFGTWSWVLYTLTFGQRRRKPCQESRVWEANGERK